MAAVAELGLLGIGRMAHENVNQITIGSISGDHVTIRVLRRSHPMATDYWDGNWLNCEVTAASGAFRGSFAASLRSDEFDRFRAALTTLYRELSGSAQLAPMEDQVQITLSGDGKGRVTVEGLAIDRVGTGNRLSFLFDIDQTYLPPVLSSLQQILDTFPVIGSSDA